MGKKSRESQSNPDKKSKESLESNMKYYFFLALFIFPSLAWIMSVAGDVLNNVGGVFGSIANGILISTPIILPILIAMYSTKLRGVMLRAVLPVAIAVLLFPTIQVYLCSPVYLKNEDLGTRHSLQTNAEKFLRDSCVEHCLNHSKIPSVYQLALFSPRVSIRVHHHHIIDLNLTTTANVGGEIIKIAKLLLLPSWRSVKGRYHALNLIARIPVKVKKLNATLKAKQDMILSGKMVNIPNDLKRLKGELEKQKRFVRPLVLEVFRITPIEIKDDADKEEERQERKQKGKQEKRKEKQEEKPKEKQEEKAKEKPKEKQEKPKEKQERPNEKQEIPKEKQEEKEEEIQEEEVEEIVAEEE